MRRQSNRLVRFLPASMCLLLALLPSNPMDVHGAAPCPSPSIDLKSEEWKVILAKRGLSSNDRIAVLVFDHVTSAWSVCHYSPKNAAGMDIVPQPEPLGPDGNPLVLRSGAEKLLILVTNTNPFLYAYESVVHPPQDSADATTLRTLASTLGSAAAGVGHAAGIRVVIDVKGTKETLDKISKAIRNADDHRLEARAFAQGFEFAPTDPPPDDLTPGSIAKDTKDVISALKDARSLRSTLNPDGVPAACFQPWADLLSLLGNPGAADVPAMSERDLEAVRNELLRAPAWSAPNCLGTLSRERQIIDTLLGLTGAAQQQESRKVRDDSTTNLIRITYALDQVIAKEKDIYASLSVSEAFSRIAGDYLGVVAGKYQILPRTSIAVVVPPFPAQRWLKDNPGTLSIKAEGAVCADCTRLKPTALDKKFLLASRRQNVLGLGFGVVHTTIKDPTFGAVHDKDAQVIARTSEDSRSGAIVVTGSLRLISAFSPNSKPRWAEPCLDIGAGVDVKKPSLFLGVSVEFLRYVRLGFGQTWQVVNRLDDGLQEAKYGSDGLPVAGTGTTITAAGDIRTRNRVTSRPYVSLSFALDALPFFQPK